MNVSFISQLKELEKVCDHFHLSLQSGCDATLKRMNRHYTAEEFFKGVQQIQKVYPNAALTTDVIVGFPQESEEEFEETYSYLEKVDFYRMHIFKYSPRKGTRAANMDGQVSGEKKEERSKKLIVLSNQKEEEHHQKQIGRVVKVLIEEEENGYLKGHTTNYILVKIKIQPEESKQYINQIVKVSITEAKVDALIGKLWETR